ncbi:ion channel [Brevundimonas lenta]|uniref:Potassium channel domain-containing protein n=1 Tax=Brevundimonas lenta TaxID=424796 RepID=A0A7W6NN67_9CAUL|nr:ion channel [Brevundimonas lenta]MBB4082050.1 hypothetical protein [Brevundimonas lenta]
MILELVIATIMVLITVAMHASGLLLMARGIKHHDHRTGRVRLNAVSIEAALLTVLIILGLFVLHGAQIWLYAVLFHGLGAVANFRDAIYFSTISYGAIGYGDAEIAEQWKLLGAIEGINGVILLGWSVAFFVTVMARIVPTPHRRVARGGGSDARSGGGGAG